MSSDRLLEFLPIASFFVIVVGFLFARWDKSVDRYKDVLKDTKDHAELKEKLVEYGRPWQNYMHSLRAVDSWLNNYFFQSNKHGIKSLSRCFSVALFYPTVFFLATWTIGGDIDLLEHYFILPEIESPFTRTAIMTILTIASFSLYSLIVKGDNLTSKEDRTQHKLLTEPPVVEKVDLDDGRNRPKTTPQETPSLITSFGLQGNNSKKSNNLNTRVASEHIYLKLKEINHDLKTLLSKLSKSLILSALEIVLFLCILLFFSAYLFGGSEYKALITLAFLLLALTYLRATEDFFYFNAKNKYVPVSIIASLILLLIIVVSDLFVSVFQDLPIDDGSRGIEETSRRGIGIGVEVFIYYAFLVALPFANAIFDWASWGVTRFLLRKAAAHKRKLSTLLLLFLELFLDILFALICLAALSVCLCVIFEHWNQYNLDGFSARVDWLHWAGKARIDPLGEGVWITLMIFSTFLPTAIHLAFGIRAIFLAVFPSTRFALNSLHEGSLTESSALKVAKTLALYDYLFVPAIVLSSIITGLLVYSINFYFPRFWDNVLLLCEVVVAFLL